MTTIRVAQAVQLLYAKGWGPGCLANTDLVNPVFFGHDQALGPSSDQIPALGAIPVDGSRDIYGSTLAGGVTVAVQSMPGVTNWAPSPAQVSAQISTLGLAKDTTVGNVHTDLALGTNQFLSGASASAIAGAGSTVAKDVGNTGLSAAVPVKAASYGPFAANAAWGPTGPFTFPLGGAYKIIITPSVAGDAFMTDLTVTHSDSSGATVYTEAFSVTNIGNSGLSGGLSPLGGVIIRGNLHGPKLSLSGLTISQANFNTVAGTAVFTVSGINVALYYDSHAIPETKPKVVPWVNTGYLAFISGLAVNAGVTFDYGIMPSYAGSAYLTVRAPAGGGAGIYARVLSFSVLNGTTSLYTIYSNEATGLTTGVGPLPMAVDQLVHKFQVTNPTGINGTVDANLITGDYI